MTQRQLPEAVDRTYLGVPQSVAAAYENKWAGNLIAYPVDYDPVTTDPVYRKLDKMHYNPLYWGEPKGRDCWVGMRAGKTAYGLMARMKARQLNERQYNHLSKTPAWRLKLEFALTSLMNELIGRQDVEDLQLRRQMDLDEARFQRNKAIGSYLKPGF